jgi:GWxTD domain-containing protein
MSDEEQSLIKSIVLMTDPDALREGKIPLPDVEEQQAFWTERDPLFLSPLNERLMEHCGRVAYANLRFTDSHRRLEGWETDKGELYIRYGKPQSRFVRAAEIRIPRFEAWDYGSFQVWFANPISSAWRFEGGRVGRVTLNQKKDLVERIREKFKDPYQWDKFRIPYQVGQFRGSDDKTRIEVYYGLSHERIATDDEGSGYVEFPSLKQGLFFFDASWDTVYSEVLEVSRLPRVYLAGVERHYALGSDRLSMTPGNYSVVFEAEDKTSRAIGSFRDLINVRSFAGTGLNISSLLLARRITEADGVEGRERFTILPNPMRRFDSGGKGALYFEIYNLKQDEFGRTNYEVTYQLRSLTEVGEVQDPVWETALTYQHDGSTALEPIHFELDLRTVPPGLWDARIMVKDLRTDATVTTGDSYRVLW